MTKKYLVCPEFVKSRNDGDVHYIPAQKLMQLYDVDPRECVIHDARRCIGRREENLILLLPDYTGEYKIPGEKDDK